MTVWHPELPADVLARVLRDGGVVNSDHTLVTLAAFTGPPPAWFLPALGALLDPADKEARTRYGPTLVHNRPAAARGWTGGEAWVRLLGLTLNRRPA